MPRYQAKKFSIFRIFSEKFFPKNSKKIFFFRFSKFFLKKDGLPRALGVTQKKNSTKIGQPYIYQRTKESFDSLINGDMQTSKN